MRQTGATVAIFPGGGHRIQSRGRFESLTLGCRGAHPERHARKRRDRREPEAARVRVRRILSASC